MAQEPYVIAYIIFISEPVNVLVDSTYMYLAIQKFIQHHMCIMMDSSLFVCDIFNASFERKLWR